MEWQPIDTAPKDGTAVLITNAGVGMLVRIGCFVPVQLRKRDEPTDASWWAVNDELIDEYSRPGMRPAYWMPLPEAPKSEA